MTRLILSSDSYPSMNFAFVSPDIPVVFESVSGTTFVFPGTCVTSSWNWLKNIDAFISLGFALTMSVVVVLV
ncbi:unnamed protein product [Clonostachys solani]|uniref:Uncharacterized protein n=1 Tax=Clonostachys solani TaxID=160281 RepID=A0A9N9ZCT3_9HYPO|nr:unnamed protein product [Clonostachys solani]